MIRTTFIICSIIFILGCQTAQQTSPYQQDDQLNDYIDFAPAKIKIINLTEFVNDSNLKIYIDLIDKFGSRVKSPAVFRFELYEYIERSAEPKGRRIFLWPGIDLTDASVNDAHWRDFLHSYEFNVNIDFDLDSGRTYILRAFCRTSAGNRLTAEKQLTLTNR